MDRSKGRRSGLVDLATCLNKMGARIAGAGTSTIRLLDGDAATVSIVSTSDGDEEGPVDGVFTVTQSTASISDTVRDSPGCSVPMRQSI